MARRLGMSLMEVVIGALILGVSGVLVIELVRSSTVNLELTEIEAVARGLAADLLERYAQGSYADAASEQKATKITFGVPVKWDAAVDDPAFRFGFPKEKLQSLLDTYQVMFTVDVKPLAHPTYGGASLSHVSVKVQWLDQTGRSRDASSEYKSVTYACLVDR